ncbi:MAG TPA: chemotaxis-specific protein-glutamate methyltransferase CheB [Sphingomonadaceae bacterium]|nr:chemotaxis-specific protein-glutamate methyltransferase CheB [Sphingomonadaceae bacterium]
MPGARHRQPIGEPIRLMVVDDSVTARTVFSRIIAREEDLELVVEAATAEEALEILTVADVDVILLDLEMPGMGGLEAMPQLIEAAPEAQILVVSSLTVEGAEPTLTALSLGAADTLAKPRPGTFDQEYRDRLLAKIRALGGAEPAIASPAAAALQRKAPDVRPASEKQPRILAIGASTGGIHALGLFFRALPVRLDMPILVTQHLPASFMDAFARQLQQASGRPATLAVEGLTLQADHIYVAPGTAHMTVVEGGGRYKIRLDKVPATSGCMPSVDPMFASLAQAAGPHALGVILSGMGRDGTLGAGEIVAAGGSIFVQDEASCAVWGMPGSAAMAGLASCILPPDRIAERVAKTAKVTA